MSDSASDRSQHEQQLDAIIAEYYAAAERGQPPDRAEFLRQHPDFSAELRDFFAGVGQIEQVAPPLRPALEDTRQYDSSRNTSLSPGVLVRYVGDYEILEELGSGGMGVVYKARQAKLKKIVALKMIKMGQLASEQEVRRFQAEARAAANLNHPGIVTVHEVGVDHHHHYYAMDYVAGDSLSKLHRDEPVAARRAAELVKQLAEAMHYAHGQGIVHRDLKPANVLLTTVGTPRITDFGLAKRLWSDEESAGVTMTETGQVLGTAGYMSPEQAAGKTRLVGPPADIYALGAILYALLTSRAPFVGESYADTILQVIHNEPVSPRVLNPSISRDLETICLKCLEKEPHKRYGTAQLLADDLSRFWENRPVLARPVTRLERGVRWARRNPVVSSLSGGILALLVSVACITTWAYFRATSDAQEKTRFAQTEKSARLETERQLRVATAERLAAQAIMTSGDNPVTAALLAVEGVEATAAYQEPVRPSAAEGLLNTLVSVGGRPLTGHRDRVSCVALTADGRWLVTGSWDGAARLWDLQTPDPAAAPKVLRAHEGGVSSLALSADGRWLVTGSDDKTIRVWDLRAANPATAPKVLRCDEGGPSCLALSADGRWLVTKRKTIHLWDLRAADPAAEPKVLRCEEGGPLCLGLSADGHWLVTGCGDKTVRVWDLQAADPGAAPKVLRGHVDYVMCLALSADSRWLVTGSTDNAARVWDLQAVDPTAGPRVLRGHDHFVTCLALSADGRWLVTGSADKSARLWDLQASDPAAAPKILRGHDHFVTCLALSADGRWLVTGSADKSARLWDLQAPDQSAAPKILRGHQNGILCVALKADGRSLVTGSLDTTARLWDLQSTKPAAVGRVFRGHKGDYLGAEGGVVSLALSADGRWLVTGSDDRTARLWDLHATDLPATVLRGHAGAIRCLAFSADSRWLVTGSHDKTACLWDLQAADPAATRKVLRGHEFKINCLALSADGRWLATGSWDGAARIWDLQAADPAAAPKVLRGHELTIDCLALSANGRWLVTGSADTTARLWDLQAADPDASSTILRGHDSMVTCLALSADGRWLVTGSSDNTARAWDLHASDPDASSKILRGHELPIYCLAISADCRWLVTGSHDKTARVWDLQAVDPTAGPRVLRGHAGYISCLALSADARWLVTGSSDKTARVWLLDFQDLCDLARSYAGRELSADERRLYAIPEPPAVAQAKTRRPPLPPFLINLPRVVPIATSAPAVDPKP